MPSFTTLAVITVFKNIPHIFPISNISISHMFDMYDFRAITVITVMSYHTSLYNGMQEYASYLTYHVTICLIYDDSFKLS